MGADEERATTVPEGLEREALRLIDRRSTLLDAALHAAIPCLPDLRVLGGPDVDLALDDLHRAITGLSPGTADVRRRAAATSPALAISLATWAAEPAMAALAGEPRPVTLEERDVATAALIAAVAPRADVPPETFEDGATPGCVDLLARAPADDAGWQSLVTALLVDEAVDQIVDCSLLPAMVDAAMAPGVRPHPDGCGPLCAFFLSQARHVGLALDIADLRLRKAAWALASEVLADAGQRAVGIAAARERLVEAYMEPATSAALDLVDLLAGAALDAVAAGGRGRRGWR